MFALIIDGTVREVIHQDSLEGLYHSDFVAQCVPCSEGVQVGMAWDGEAFGLVPQVQKPAPDPVSVARSYMLADAADLCELKEVLADLLGL